MMVAGGHSPGDFLTLAAFVFTPEPHVDGWPTVESWVERGFDISKFCFIDTYGMVGERAACALFVRKFRHD